MSPLLNFELRNINCIYYDVLIDQGSLLVVVGVRNIWGSTITDTSFNPGNPSNIF